MPLRTTYCGILSTHSYQELTPPSPVLLFLLIHELLSSLLPRQKQQSVKFSSNQWVHGDGPHCWPFSSPWSEVPMAFFLHASAFLRIMECYVSCYISSYSGEMPRHRFLTWKPHCPVMIQFKEKTCARTLRALGSGPAAPRVREKWDTDHTWSNPEPAPIRQDTCLVFSSLTTTPVPLTDDRCTWNWIQAPYQGLQSIHDHGLSLHSPLVPLDLVVPTPQHLDLISFLGTFQILPWTRTFTLALSSAWSMTALAFHVSAILQDLVQMTPFQRPPGPSYI